MSESDGKTEDTGTQNGTLTVAAIGLGIMGSANLNAAGRAGMRIAALCDVDQTTLNRAAELFPEATLYTDYRKLLESEKEIDGVIISTPNHTHAVIAIAAMERGRHVYCEKPLAHTVYEMRQMIEAAHKHNVTTQMGNQGHSYKTNREFCECVRSGAIGEIREAHMVLSQFSFSQIDHLTRLDESHPLPETLDWDLWLGPAQYRGFSPVFHPLAWRHWRWFSTGLIGDMFCHIADPLFSALGMRTPTSVMAEAEGYEPGKHGDTFPKSSKIRFEFPEKGPLPALTLYWYDGTGYAPPRPAELKDGEELIPGSERGASGGYVVGDKGKIAYASHGAARWRIIPASKMAEYTAGRSMAGDERGRGIPDPLPHLLDWERACQTGDPAGSNFDYGGGLAEIATIGNIALKVPGVELQWDAEKMAFTNHPEANVYLHYEYRDGWTL